MWKASATTTAETTTVKTAKRKARGKASELFEKKVRSEQKIMK